jgi:phosphohistidine phosphatase
MQVLIIRHAKAEKRSLLGLRDAARALTDEGRRDMRKVARGIEALVPDLSVLATSPLVRAVQTAEIVTRRYRKLKAVECAALAPGRGPKAALEWLGKQPGEATVGLVGHEPDLGELASWLLAGGEQSFMPLKKAGACLIEFDATPDPGQGRLLWLLTPAQLRRLGG